MQRKVGLNDKATLREVLELHRLEEQYKEYKRRYEQQKKSLTTSISNYMYSNGYGSFDFRSREFGSVKVNKIIRRSVVWNVDKLKKRLSSKTFEEITEKHYTINDMNGLVEYLKSCGVSPKKFKQFIDVETKVVNDKVNHLSDIGDLEMEDIRGCYTLREANPYLRIDVKSLEEE